MRRRCGYPRQLAGFLEFLWGWGSCHLQHFLDDERFNLPAFLVYVKGGKTDGLKVGNLKFPGGQLVILSDCFPVIAVFGNSPRLSRIHLEEISGIPVVAEVSLECE